MVRKISLNKNILAFLILTSVILVVFYKLTQTFYQQDEWNGMGLVYSEGIKSVFPETFKPIDILIVKGRFVSSFIFYLFAKFYPLQNLPIAIFALVLHIIATMLVFFLIRKYNNNYTAAILGSSLFALNSVAHGTVTWSVIAISTVGSSIFIFWSILTFFKFIETSKSKWLLITGLLLYISLWFKETGIYLFLFFPLVSLFLKKYKFSPSAMLSYFKQFWMFLLPFLLIVGYRILELRLRTTTSNLYLTGADENFFLTLFIRAILYPLTSFSLMYVPGNYFIQFARVVIHDNYPFFADAPNFLLIAQSVALDVLALVLTIFIIFLTLLLLRKEEKEKAKIVLFWLAFSLFSFVPYIVLAKDFSYLESRYYYVPVAGGAVLLAWFLLRLRQIIGKLGFLVFIVPLSSLFILWHTNTIEAAIEEQVKLSNTRKSLMFQLAEQLPTLSSQKNVFYITSDKNYWADTNMLPFQQGSGYTLMVLYYNSGKIPKSFLINGYLFEIGSQGYKESGDMGFGFFTDKKELEKAVTNYNLPPSSILHLQYLWQDNKLVRVGD